MFSIFFSARKVDAQFDETFARNNYFENVPHVLFPTTNVPKVNHLFEAGRWRRFKWKNCTLSNEGYVNSWKRNISTISSSRFAQLFSSIEILFFTVLRLRRLARYRVEAFGTRYRYKSSSRVKFSICYFSICINRLLLEFLRCRGCCR